MYDFIGAIKNGLNLASILVSGENKEKCFSVALRKDARKALNVAEDIFRLVDGYCMGELTKKPFKAKYDSLRKKFDKLD